jgi:hypothetical protein
VVSEVLRIAWDHSAARKSASFAQRPAQTPAPSCALGRGFYGRLPQGASIAPPPRHPLVRISHISQAFPFGGPPALFKTQQMRDLPLIGPHVDRLRWHGPFLSYLSRRQPTCRCRHHGSVIAAPSLHEHCDAERGRRRAALGLTCSARAVARAGQSICRRHPLASVATLVLGLRCSWWPESAPMPRILGLHALPPAAKAAASNL